MFRFLTFSNREILVFRGQNYNKTNTGMSILLLIYTIQAKYLYIIYTIIVFKMEKKYTDKRNFNIETLEKVRDALTEKSMTKYELSKELNISYPILNSILEWLEKEDQINFIEEKNKYARLII